MGLGRAADGVVFIQRRLERGETEYAGCLTELGFCIFERLAGRDSIYPGKLTT